ncbi:hypothetical protein K493DRAFT_309947 [Basidiobolus meristosporus CBS 931.73]|uniref:Transcriptional regulatory protein RXT2 N-terminal domain-containing protein n=1 Tax=Basidiobolus meristosporus CBS 931.73 TaxID=1314790 RepID=A0A1Y1ZCX3_9FUNG|nr:hypothetical protein K493DRAFT_309947 [Basidiobolus meristosporus CBS 931.73]|eukprot:ORY08142.1 hypothetical protein K493DRAFT_309947 [Basidiobolus meristosporus CBS 931.73]
MESDPLNSSKPLFSDAEPSDSEEIGFCPHNRGKKLKLGADHVHGNTRLWTFKATVGATRDISTTSKKRGNSLDGEDAAAVINIKELLSPPERLEDFTTKYQYRHIMKDNRLEFYIIKLMEVIEAEGKKNRNLRRLLSMLQRDEPSGKESTDDEEISKEEYFKTWEAVQEALSHSNALLEILGTTRSKLTYVERQKSRLWKKLKSKKDKAS